MKTFTVNGMTYEAKPFDFNLACDLDEMGVSIAEIQKKPMSVVRSYLALCMGADKDAAGEQIEQHIMNGGDLDELLDAMTYEINESGFFQKMAETAGKKVVAKKKATAR